MNGIRGDRRWWWLLVAACGLGADGPPAPGVSRPIDVVRPTVQLRHGETTGSGTIIASVDGRTLVLTAAHVLEGAAEVTVELHRHNLGMAYTGLTEGGGWPRRVRGTVVARDVSGDVALVRIDGMVALPHVARLDPAAGEPKPGEVVTSVGVDRSLHLTRWRTSVKTSARVDVHRGGGPRLFTVVTRFPDFGHSGGGLFRADGAVVGVCTGQLSTEKGRPKLGLFASMDTVRRLLASQGLIKAGGGP